VFFIAARDSGGGGIYMTRGILSTTDLDSFPISGLIMLGFCNGWRPNHIRKTFQIKNRMGAMMKTTTPSTRTSNTIRYMTHNIPKMSHQRWGELRRHVWEEVYSRIWAVRNQLSVINDDKTVRRE
jgi:hypothetical protein